MVILDVLICFLNVQEFLLWFVCDVFFFSCLFGLYFITVVIKHAYCSSLAAVQSKGTFFGFT